jgi:hypothetical protein
MLDYFRLLIDHFNSSDVSIEFLEILKRHLKLKYFLVFYFSFLLSSRVPYIFSVFDM